MIENRTESPCAVHCFSGCGKVCLTKDEYRHQMMRPDSLWKCPICGSSASWDDKHYEAYLDKEIKELEEECDER